MAVAAAKKSTKWVGDNSRNFTQLLKSTPGPPKNMCLVSLVYHDAHKVLILALVICLVVHNCSLG